MIMEKITAKNFVTDNRTNKLYISSLIDRENGALDAIVRSKLKLSILDYRIKEMEDESNRIALKKKINENFYENLARIANCS